MCVGACVCVCVRAFMRAYLCGCMHAYVLASMHAYVLVSMHVCVCACKHACMRMCLQACMCVYELRTVSTDTILCFINSLIIIILRRKEVKLPGFTSPVADILCCSQVQACVHSQCLLFFHTNHLESVQKKATTIKSHIRF